MVTDRPAAVVSHTPTLRVTVILAAAVSLFILVYVSLRTRGTDFNHTSFPAMVRAHVLPGGNGSTSGRVCSDMKCLQDGSTEKAIVIMA